MKKWLIILTMAASLVLPCSAKAISGSYFTGAAHSLNNDLVGVDYKLSQEEQEDYVADFQYSFLSKEDLDESGKYINPSTDRIIDLSDYENYGSSDYNKSTLDDMAVAKSYLLTNNLLERKSCIYYDAGTGLFGTENYEEVSKAWDALFEQKVVEVRANLGGNAFLDETGEAFEDFKVSSSIKTKNDVLAIFNDYIDFVINDELLNDLLNVNQIEEDSLTNVIKNLRKRKTQLRKDVKKTSTLKETCDLAVEYVSDVQRYAQGFKPPLLWSDDSSVTKSELMVLLAKAGIGVQPARPIVWNQPAVRNGKSYSQSTLSYWDGGSIVSMIPGYWDTGQYKGSANFESGDFYYYVSSNVYEIYLKALLDRGIIFQDELGSTAEAKAFRKAYLNYDSELPSWAQTQGASSFGVKNTLGAGYAQKGTTLTCNNVTYFSDETLTTIEIYQYVEDILRTTEKDITETESDIITFKFGLDFLAPYSGSKLKTLKFLIAKGILNYENPDEFYNLDEPMTYRRLFQLLYRMHSHDARYDFSQVQLTDSESYWMAKGYAESTLAYTDSSSSFVMSDGATEELGDDDDEVASATDLLDGLLNITSVQAANKTWITTFKLSKDLDWKFAGTSLSELASGSSANASIKSIKEKTISYNGTTTDIYVLKIAHVASSEASALRWSRNQLSTTSGSRDGVETIVKVTEKGKAKDDGYSMISQSTLRKSFSAVSVMQDKVLVNTNTGTQAILFADLQCAWVGNTIVYTDGLLYDETNDEIYYNLKVIMALLDDVFMEQAGIKSAIFHTPKKFISNYATVKTEYDDAFSQAECLTFKATKKMASMYPDDYEKGDNIYYYKVDDMSDGMNTVVRKFTLDGKGDCWLIVDWEFVIPDLSDFSEHESISKALKRIFEGDGSNYREKLKRSTVTKAFYTRPAGSPIMEAWWDSNYFVNNAIMNYLLGTEGIDYITSGYLTPSITLLGPDTKSFTDSPESWLMDVFQGIHFTEYHGKTDDGNTKDASSTLKGYVDGNTNNEWFKGFYSEESFDGALTVENSAEGAEDTLQSLVAAYRHLNFYSLKDFGKQGSFFEMQYFVTKAGIVYKNLSNETRLSFGTTKKSNNNVVNSIKLTTREPDVAEPKIGDVVAATGKDRDKKGLLYTGYVESTDDAPSYYTFVPAQDVVHLDPTDKLYNGAYVGINVLDENNNVPEEKLLDTGFGTFDIVLDRGVKSNGKCPDNKHRYVSPESMYNKWGKKLLGEGAFLPFNNMPATKRFHFSNKLASKIKGVNWDNYIWVSPGEKAVETITFTNFKKEDEAHKFYDQFMEQLKLYLKGSKVKTIPNRFNDYLGEANGVYFMYLPSLSKDTTDNLYRMNRIGYGMQTIAACKDNEPNRTFSKQAGSIWMNAGLQEIPCQGMTDRLCLIDNEVVNKDYVAIAVPMFYVSAEDYSIIEDSSTTPSTFELIQGGTLTAFSFSNFYYSGIMKSIQETVIARYVDTVTLDQLKKGNVVNIEGVRYFVDESEHSGKGVWLTSACLNVNSESKARRKLRELALDWKDSNTKSQNDFMNKALNSLLGSTLITCDGFAYPLTGYVLNQNSKMPDKGVQVGGKKDTKAIRKNGLIYYNGKHIMGYKSPSKGSPTGKTDKKITKSNKGDYQYFRVRFYLNGKLRVRPLNATHTKYVLTTTTVSGNITSAETAFQYFNEELNRQEDLYSDLEAVSSKFNPSPIFTAVKAVFMKDFHKTMGNDIRTWILMIICVFSVYLCVMSWIAYLVLHYGVLHSLFNALESGTQGQGAGFDAVKFFTIGLFKLDDDPPLHRVIIIQFVCIVIAAICISII